MKIGRRTKDDFLVLHLEHLEDFIIIVIIVNGSAVWHKIYPGFVRYNVVVVDEGGSSFGKM
jgi:hypothetical protein